MKYPSSTVPAEWAQAFERWITDPDTFFDTKAMEEWFRAAFEAAGQAPTPAPVAQPAPAAPVAQQVTSGDGVWLTYSRVDNDVATVRPWATELEALRQAVTGKLEAQFVEFGGWLEP